MKAVAFVWCQAKLDPHRVVAAVRRYHQQYLHDGRPAGLIHTIANAACARHLSTHSHWLLAPSWMLVQAWPGLSIACNLVNQFSIRLSSMPKLLSALIHYMHHVWSIKDRVTVALPSSLSLPSHIHEKRTSKDKIRTRKYSRLLRLFIKIE
jgi:hypothetical protein